MDNKIDQFMVELTLIARNKIPSAVLKFKEHDNHTLDIDCYVAGRFMRQIYTSNFERYHIGELYDIAKGCITNFIDRRYLSIDMPCGVPPQKSSIIKNNIKLLLL